MDPACDMDVLRAGMINVAKELSCDPGLLPLYVEGFGPIRIAPNEGYISYVDEQEYETAIRWALDIGAEPSNARRPREKAATSRLFLELKNVFNTFGWLAKFGQGINDHVIVPRYQLSLEEGLSVDFALQNSAMHYLQTSDFRTASHVSQRRTEVQAKALVLGLSEQLGPNDMKHRRYFLVAGSNEDEARKSIKLMERISDNVFIHESRQDMQELMDTFGSAMGQDSFPALSTQ
jgi:hypothetical protein